MAADFRRDGARSWLLWDVLRAVVSARVAETGRQALDIVDVGGGTGGLAVPFAALGHQVTVVDPSPDALAAAQRRAAESGARLASVQGDAASLDSVAGAAAADLIICHNVLEYVEDPADAMSAISRVLRPSAIVSVLASNAVAAVLHRALAGRFAEARRLLVGTVPVPAGQGVQGVQGVPAGRGGQGVQGVTAGQGGQGVQGVPAGQGGQGVPAGQGSQGVPAGQGSPGGRGAPCDEGLGDRIQHGIGENPGGFGIRPPGGTPRRFTLPELTALIEGAGLRAGEAHGLRIFGGLVPGALVDGDAAAEALRALEETAASTPPLRDIAAQLHVLGYR